MSENPPLLLIGIDHIYLSVTDFEKSERFYDSVMEALGLKKGDKSIAGEPHAHLHRSDVSGDHPARQI